MLRCRPLLLRSGAVAWSRRELATPAKLCTEAERWARLISEPQGLAGPIRPTPQDAATREAAAALRARAAALRSASTESVEEVVGESVEAAVGEQSDEPPPRHRAERATDASLESVVALRSRLALAIGTLGEGLLERETEVRLLLLAAVTGEHRLLLGPPGRDEISKQGGEMTQPEPTLALISLERICSFSDLQFELGSKKKRKRGTNQAKKLGFTLTLTLALTSLESIFFISFFVTSRTSRYTLRNLAAAPTLASRHIPHRSPPPLPPPSLTLCILLKTSRHRQE